MRRQPVDHQPTRPATRTTGSTVPLEFFPGEAARLLQLGDVAYEQLRTLFVLARYARGETAKSAGWARFDAEDLASSEVLVGLAGGRERFQPNRRLNLRDIKPACAKLRELGFVNPLLEVPLARHGRQVIALVGSHVYAPSTGQLAFAFVGDQVEQLVAQRESLDRDARLLVREVRRQREARRIGAKASMAALEAHVESIARAT